MEQKKCICECKNSRKCKKDYSWDPSKCENRKYLKNIADTSVTECDEIMIVMVIVSTKKTNTIATKKDKYYSNKCYKYCFKV